MIFNSKNEFGSQKPWNETSLLLHSTSCSTEHLRKGRTKNETFEDWYKKHREQPKFPYWSCVLELELSILQFTQSIRTAYFNQFIQTLTKLLPCCCCCCFAIDDITYARWLSEYLCDMCLPISVSSPLQWWICCAQAHGQAHEQRNAMVKGNGGAVGLASNPGFLRRWVTAGPQFARSFKCFENSMTSKSADCLDHHEQSHAPQKAFSWDKRSSSCFFWGSWKSIWRRWRMPLRPGLQSHCRRGCHDCS